MSGKTFYSIGFLVFGVLVLFLVLAGGQDLKRDGHGAGKVNVVIATSTPRPELSDLIRATGTAWWKEDLPTPFSLATPTRTPTATATPRRKP